jgi:two-component system, chemotaxis family, protein-glutamate methylesterase/glutaminase
MSMLPGKYKQPVKVLIVDDSAFYRQTFLGMLRSVREIEVIGTAPDGLEAMRFLSHTKPDVITLDLEMPRMDGFTFLRWLMANNPIPVVVISSRSEKSNVFKALELGAVDFVAKPTHRASLDVMKIQSELLAKVEAASNATMEKLTAREIEEVKPVVPVRIVTGVGGSPIQLIAIGASTGGPPAIERILQRLPEKLGLAIVIAQHMPPIFTQYFAERLDKIAHLRVKEGEQDEEVAKNTVYVAPGGNHMKLIRQGEKVHLSVETNSETDRYVPSVDFLLESAAEAYGSAVMGILLTGMGRDGKEGMRRIRKLGGVTVAEAEETAVVFGMPKEAIMAGLVDKVLLLHDIPGEIASRCS